MTRARDLANIADGTFTATDLDLSGTLTVSGDATFDTNTLFVDVSTDRVGVGTTSPAAKLHLFGDVGDGLRIDRNNTGAVGNQIAFRHSNAGTLTETAAINAISTANADTGTLAFYTKASGGSNSEAMRIDYLGNLLVGKTTTAGAFNTVGTELRATGLVQSTVDGSKCIDLNRKTSDGAIIGFSKDGTAVGSINAHVGDLSIGTGDVRLKFSDSGSKVSPRGNTDLARDGAIDLGGSSDRFRNLYLSGGVYLGGTGAANLLDDYEEGTWTPTCAQATISINNARYTKIGDIVHLIAYLGVSSATNTDMTIGGIPFSVAANGWAPSIVNKGANASIVAMIRANATSGTILDVKDPSDTGVKADQVGNFFIFSLTYRTA